MSKWETPIVKLGFGVFFIFLAFYISADVQKLTTPREYPLWCHNDTDIALSGVCSKSTKQRDV